MRTFSAPGKLVIAGEYAVLEGRPALVAAVDRRAFCRVEDAPVLQVSALGQGPLEAVVQGGEVRFPRDEAGAFGLISAVLSEGLRSGVPLPSAHLVIESEGFRAFDKAGHELKLGLGSSAAVAVALAAALYGGERSGLTTFWLADRAHRRFSGGGGSGIDAAASSLGGVLRFERAPGRPASVERSRLCPAGVSPLVAFAGTSVSTRRMLERMAVFAQEQRKQYLERMDAIEWATVELLGANSAGEDPAVFLAAYERCHAAMRRLGEAADVDIVSEPHRQIARIARRLGGAAKPSGAGGGDVALCFIRDEARADLAGALDAAGFAVVDVRLGAPGAREDH